ncbi:signal transduction histidine kinase [Sphingomonas kaistensis]|uniref:histidine kinase n=1 Tax=Sphingomonas kaistensis TaxID=298708 RepID=A0A7X5Y6J5_9SPHN|nr:response regulator [Sphingomonas kaistensis]NJC05730.1 signal transduction histidine kinase [Sphingomonas kaistensis]
MTGPVAPVPLLIVDDLEENLLSLAALLKSDDLTLLHARSGEEALELLLKHDVALALLDVQMPGMDGFELAEFMRGSERSRRVPIIFVTAGSGDTQRRFRGYEAGAVDFIQKPIEADILRSKVGVFVDLHKQRIALSQSADQLEGQVRERTAELHRALQRLQEEVAERERAEASLRQSQKMEAIGQLTGGIAHDFNNMLTGIIGSLDMMRRRIADNRFDGLERYLETALGSAERAAALTHRLLAFARRQPLEPRALDVAAVIQSVAQLVTHALPESVTLRLAIADDLPHALADSNQLENAVLNLAVNARDAMPDGGELVISASLADPARVAAIDGAGEYLLISVADTGGGMPPEIVERVFEPFFTTKPLGQGTGLGLSMVYGFAQQSGGTVRIDSRPGSGTAIDLYLPTTRTAPVADDQVSAPAHKGAGQRVLLVEDEDAVRMLVREVLEELGYEAIEIADPAEALPVLASGQPIDLMISDVGMPGINGRELADTARRHRPDLPILFITGYDRDAATQTDFLAPGMSLITKPFSLDGLAASIGELIGANRP